MLSLLHADLVLVDGDLLHSDYESFQDKTWQQNGLACKLPRLFMSS
jgi:hypothetical protein